jgi:hypothetical protein
VGGRGGACILRVQRASGARGRRVGGARAVEAALLRAPAGSALGLTASLTNTPPPPSTLSPSYVAESGTGRQEEKDHVLDEGDETWVVGGCWWRRAGGPVC